MTVVGSLRASRLGREIATRKEVYGRILTAGERERIQLELLNQEWRRILDSVPVPGARICLGRSQGWVQAEET